MTSDAMVKSLVGRYFPCFGIPNTIVSDNAAVFKFRLLYNTCFSSGIKHITTSTYYPQASQVEQFNRNLKAALTIYHNSHHTRWDENLQSLAMVLNTEWHKSTGATPALLFLGRELKHPLGLKWEFSELDLKQSPPDTKVFLERALKT
jgi:hypothetical protein